jgi:ribosomal protein S3
MSGRLSGRKQGMAKTVSKTIGVLPFSGLKQTVDYDQGFVTTKLGCLGIKFGFTNFCPLKGAKQGQGLNV